MNSEMFKELLTERGRELYRQMPWREDARPYYVLVSELMLQQTQVERVIPKFKAFVSAFPDELVLAEAGLAEVLTMWSGLGYNRRAKYLHDAAKMVVQAYGGVFPATSEELRKLPGVGLNTAGAIMAYAYNMPVVFVETNVRTVYFHHFFGDGDKVSDAELRVMVERTMDEEHPREFYWALMDYGSWLKRQGIGKIQQSKHYVKQSALKGSVREVRGQIVRALTGKNYTLKQLTQHVTYDERFERALAGLVNDGLVTQTKDYLHLTK